MQKYIYNIASCVYFIFKLLLFHPGQHGHPVAQTVAVVPGIVTAASKEKQWNAIL